MLKLHQLTISGFKSFVDPVSLRFAGGITAIVGPNGCGKSNLSEAITWVLGEQSAKSLRSTTMQDVIFAGAENRKPVGMAEVSLALLTDPSFAAASEGKIEISRRVFRSGESQYRLNGKVTRLKQIKDLLMDTGLGIRAYSVIEQGKIGMILSGKPQERRKLLEEAAGITRYKARKRIAEIKLEEAIANLLRLDDIVSEVERSLRSLKRQASAARRYQAKETEYHTLLEEVLLGRWSLLYAQLQALTGELTTASDENAALTTQLLQDEAALARGREELDVIARRVAERHQHQADLAATIEGRQEYLKGARGTLADIVERLRRGQAQAEERRQQIVFQKSSLGDLDERTERLLQERDEAARVVADDEARITAAQEAVTAAEARLETLRRDLMRSLAEVNQVRSALQHEEVELEKNELRARYLEEERTRLAAQQAEATGTLDAIAEKVASAEQELETQRESRRQTAAALDTLLRREAELTNERQHLETRLAGLRQRQQILTELSQAHEARRSALIEKLADIGIDNPTFLSEQLRDHGDLPADAAGWARSIDHYLGELADAVVLEPGQDGLALAEALSEVNASGGFLQPQPDAPAPVELDDPAALESLASALALPPDLARALPPAWLVETPQDAARLAVAHPGIAFLSRHRLWAMGGVLRVQRGEAAPGVLARETELETIGQRIPDTEAEIQQAAEGLARLVDERTRHAGALHRLDEQMAALQREIAVAQARIQDATGRRSRIEASLATTVEEQQELAAAHAAADDRREALVRRRAEAEQRHETLGTEVEGGQTAVEAARAEREHQRTDGAGRRGRLELLEERLESQNQEAVRVRRQITESDRLLVLWREEAEALERRQRELEIGMEQAEEALQIALGRRQEAQDDVLAEQERLDARRDTIREHEKTVETIRETRETLRARIEQLRIDQASVNQSSEHLASTYHEAFKRHLPGRPRPPEPAVEAAEDRTEEATDEAVEGATGNERDTSEAMAAGDSTSAATATGDDVADDEDADDATAEASEALVDDVPPPPMDRAELAELEANLAQCKAVLERLGPVNVLAAREYDEQFERHGFLTTQRTDVTSSVESLKKTIHDINETSSTRFREAFVQVNQAFGEIYARLFRGGEAEMRLLDEDDVLDSGIEIVARPPGKRLQNIMLLSGGEKALTAIALLFALFRTKPSPFCILDEVDAPLDDTNVLRFVDLLREMADETQFIIVTHNKLTMEVATTLYGVTMEERGISKLVSVEMENVHPAPQQAATA